MNYFAPQRECQNVAVLQMMKAAVQGARESLGPIVVRDNPTTHSDAQHNVLAFSEEARRNSELPAEGSGLKEINSFPRMVKCHGWLNFHTSLLFDLPYRLRLALIPQAVTCDKVVRQFAEISDHIGIVYEYIEDGENDDEATKDMAHYLYLTGFYYTGTPLKKNWRGNLLVDHSDIVYPFGSGWRERFYKAQYDSFSPR